MSNTIAARLSALTAAIVVTVGLMSGVNGIAHASAAVAGTAIVTATSTAQHA